MEKSILISLGDSRMNDIAEVLGNKSCIKILELIGEQDLTTTEIADKLNMKINTADYNIKKLTKTGLIEPASRWWSVKGRKMVTYKTSNQKIIISPKTKETKFVWAFVLTGAIAVFLRSLNFQKVEDASANMLMASPRAEVLVLETSNKVVSSANFWSTLAGWEWFLIGAWGTIVLFYIYSRTKGKFNFKKMKGGKNERK